MTPMQKKMQVHNLKDEIELMAFDAVGMILYRQWLYESAEPGYGSPRMAMEHIAEVIRRAIRLQDAKRAMQGADSQ